MRPSLRVGAVYDFRNTPESGLDMPGLYAAIMDQVVMLDGLLVTWAVPPGMRPEQMNGSLESFVRDVAPRVKAAAAAA